MGTVIKIVYGEDENPNDRSLSQYIIVDFPQYCGPSWIKEHPTWVLIPPLEIYCEKFCYKIKYLPQSLT
jgi:hypothetical protein